MKLIVGLGNPGKDYENTRHNIGFRVLDEIAKEKNLNFKLSKKFQAEIALDKTGEEVIYAKPQTFMNNSGISVRSLFDFYKLSPQNVIIVHDDKDIPLGEIKTQTNRGDAGHNGVKSIIEHLGTKDFTRIRIGIAPTNEDIKETADYVLSKFQAEEKNIVQEKIVESIKKIEATIK